MTKTTKAGEKATASAESALGSGAAALKSFINRGPQIDEHAQRLSRGIFGMEHHLP